jgi:hypothetical protein
MALRQCCFCLKETLTQRLSGLLLLVQSTYSDEEAARRAAYGQPSAPDGVQRKLIPSRENQTLASVQVG